MEARKKKTYRNDAHVKVVVETSLWIDGRHPRTSQLVAYRAGNHPRQAIVDGIHEYRVFLTRFPVKMGGERSPPSRIVAVGRHMPRAIGVVGGAE